MTSVATINNLGGHAHNPRGNLWFNDESTYGHKLLMKMGWNKGKGLGKNEDGIQENLKVKFRSTNSGLGFKDDAYANIMKTEYESILQNLASEYSGTTNLTKSVDNFNSDEEPVQKSKVVKSKLRYPRLFFGKDVSKYSEKDMKSIFICSTQLKSVEEKSESTVIPEKKYFESESAKTFDTYSSSLNISDYFAKKMEEKKSGTLKKYSSNTSMHQQTSLETKNSEAHSLTNYENRTSKKISKHQQIGIEKKCINVEKLNQIATETEAKSTENVASFKKKSSRKKKKSEVSVEGAKTNSYDAIPCITVNNDGLENSFHETNSLNNNICAVENIASQHCPKRSRKRKISEAFKSDLVELSLSPTKKKKKKKVRYFSENSECENHTVAESYEETNNISLEPEGGILPNNTNCLKKKKKSKKKLKEKLKSCLKSKCGSYSLKNVSFNDTVSYRIIDSEFESVESLASTENLGENITSYHLADSNLNNSNNDTCIPDKSASDEHNYSTDVACTVEKTAPVEPNSSNNVCVKEEDKMLEESDEELTLADLPSAKSSHYNAWIGSQRQALKMQLYKGMFKGIKSHKILKTTNLLSVKGYGNWGYK